MKTLSVLIPSRSGPRQGEFLHRAIQSVIAACPEEPWDPEIIVGLDPGAEPMINAYAGVTWVEAPKASQAAALNACAKHATGDYIAILEDDDWWQPQRLAEAEPFLAEADFLSSTQLEVTAPSPVAGVVRINDFATPSGWLMSRRCWDLVGPFSEEYRFRLDNEWLGRLGNTGLKRVHLVECTAPIDPHLCEQIRPWLFFVARYGRSSVQQAAPVLRRHSQPYPLVTRLVHAASGMGQIATNPQVAGIASREEQQLRYRFGYVPW